MGRSRKVHPDWTAKVERAYQEAYDSSRCTSQREFAGYIPVGDTQVGLSIDTLNNFLKGGAVDRPYFHAICDRIGVKEAEITSALTEVATLEDAAKNEPGSTIQPLPQDGELMVPPEVIDVEYDETPENSNPAEPTKLVEIEQEVDAVEGPMVGDADEITVINGEETERSPKAEESEGDQESKSENIKITQKAKVVKKSGIMIGRSKRVNISNQGNE